MHQAKKINYVAIIIIEFTANKTKKNSPKLKRKCCRWHAALAQFINIICSIYPKIFHIYNSGQHTVCSDHNNLLVVIVVVVLGLCLLTFRAFPFLVGFSFIFLNGKQPKQHYTTRIWSRTVCWSNQTWFGMHDISGHILSNWTRFFDLNSHWFWLLASLAHQCLLYIFVDIHIMFVLV